MLLEASPGRKINQDDFVGSGDYQHYGPKWCDTGAQSHASVDIADWLARTCLPMADISDFSIVTYERKPGCWRAAVTRKVISGSVGGDKVHSVVTPDDYSSEADALFAAQKLIRKL
jgi:hypothetical protein